MKWHLCILLCLLPAVLGVRQYVEVERRPNNKHDFAGKFAFAFGLTVTFLSVVVALAFVGTFFRDVSLIEHSSASAAVLTKKTTSPIQTIDAPAKSIKFVHW